MAVRRTKLIAWPVVTGALVVAAGWTTGAVEANAVTTTRDRVTTESPVVALGVREAVAAYSLEASCDLYAWTVATSRVKAFEAGGDCSSALTFADVAVTARDIIWSELEEHNSLYASVKTTPRAIPGRWRSVYSEIDHDIGALAAGDSTIAGVAVTEPPVFDRPSANEVYFPEPSAGLPSAA